MIAQWPGTPGPQEGSGLKVQTPGGKSLRPSVTELDLGVLTKCHVEGLQTQLRMVQTHWWNAGESCAGLLPLSLSWGYRWVVRWGVLLCFPKHAQLAHITLKPILQTLITSVWMVSRSNGLDASDFFHKITSNLSKVIFQYM